MMALSASLIAADNTVAAWFADGKAYGDIRYYYIETDKDNGAGTTSSAHANTIGGELGYETAELYGLKMGATFMTTNPFALPNAVDTSIIGKDNGVRGAADPAKGFSVLGEAYLQYSRGPMTLWYGRKKYNTPLIHAKVVRLLPSTVQGGMAAATLGGATLSIGYLDRFKQRTSNDFVNIIEHALGADTETVTGHTAGYVAPLSIVYSGYDAKLEAYNYCSPDFMNALYVGAGYTYALGTSGALLDVGAQYINQQSIGNAADNLESNTSITGGKKLNSNAFGFKATLSHHEGSFFVAYTKVLRSAGDHDSLVLPWDGTPLFTNMITSNDLFQSLYGSAFQADSAYIGGTQGIKLAYAQGFDFTGISGFKATVSWAQFSNNRPGYDKDQQDINAVLAYKRDAFSLALKGIWVSNNTGASKDGTVSQLDNLTQYRVIANYTF
ncbi:MULTISPECIES: OprD family outer membrane porin [Sulfurimonas]|uniref:OprD family outer membrane porin n=1 Tax=Sulfurimonas diazotrophicus TaxID=3131939 RepID=A0ABZ3HAE6_9BACT